MKVFRCMLYICTLVSILVKQSACIVGKTSVDPQSKHELFPYLLFGFKTGGVMIESLTYSANSSDITLLLCMATDIEDIYDNKIDLMTIVDLLIGQNKGKTTEFSEDKCNQLTQKLIERCKYAKIGYDISLYKYTINKDLKQITLNLDDKTEKHNYEFLNYPDFMIRVEHENYIEKSGFYYSFISSCNGSSSTFTIQYQVLNPGNEHLSLDLIPNKITYYIFFIVWILVFIISTICMIRKCCMRKKPNLLCLLILSTYFLIMIYCIGKYYYWKFLSIRGKIDDAYEIIFLALETLIMGLYLSIINMMAYGYQITTMNVKFNPFLKNILIMGFILLTSMLMKLSRFVVMIFMIVEIIALILLLNMDIFTNISRLKAILTIQLRFDRNNKEYICILSSKIKYYRIFMIYLYTYWILECIVLFLRPFFVLYHEWIFTLVHQILTVISMSFLFITLNYTIEKFEDESPVEPINFPLPFNPKKDPKITGEIIVIHTVGEPCKSKQANRSTLPIVQIGVECSFPPPIKRKHILDPNLNKERAEIYKSENFEDLARRDISKIIDKNRQADIEANSEDNQLNNRESLSNNLKIYEELKFQNDQNTIFDSMNFNDFSKQNLKEIKNQEFAIFKAAKCLDFRKCCFSTNESLNCEDQENLSDLKNTTFGNKFYKIGKNGSPNKNEQMYLSKAVIFSSKIAKITSKHLINCIQEPIELFKKQNNYTISDQKFEETKSKENSKFKIKNWSCFPHRGSDSKEFQNEEICEKAERNSNLNSAQIDDNDAQVDVDMIEIQFI